MEKKDIQTWPKRNLSTISWACTRSIRTAHVNNGFPPGFRLLSSWQFTHAHIHTHTCCLIWKCFKSKLVYHWWFEQDLGLGQHCCFGHSLLTFAHPVVSLEQDLVWTGPRAGSALVYWIFFAYFCSSHGFSGTKLWSGLTQFTVFHTCA